MIAGKTNKLIYCNSGFHVFTIIGHKRHILEIFEYDSMHIKIDQVRRSEQVFLLKHFSSATCNVKLLSYQNISSV